MRVDFHVHSEYSPDSSGEISKILRYARRRGLDAIAITDHDTFDGNREARRLRKAGDVQIIPAIELTLPAGEIGLHIVALNVDEYVPCDGVISTIRRLKELGATIILPHPYRRDTGLFYHLENETLTSKEVSFVLENIDYLEALNMKDDIGCIQRTLQFAKETKYPMVSGSDAHLPEYIGVNYTMIAGLDNFMNGRSSGEIVTFVKSKNIPELHDLAPLLEFSNCGAHDKVAGNSDYSSIFRRLVNRIKRSRFGNMARRVPHVRAIVSFLRSARRTIRSRLEKRRRLLHIKRTIKNAPQVIISFNESTLQARLKSGKK